MVTEEKLNHCMHSNDIVMYRHFGLMYCSTLALPVPILLMAMGNRWHALPYDLAEGHDKIKQPTLKTLDFLPHSNVLRKDPNIAFLFN